MHIQVLSLFPDFFYGFLNTSIIKRALAKNQVKISIINFRTFCCDKNHKVDDYPYGGGGGMVLKVEPLYAALVFAKKQVQGKIQTILLTPSGQQYNQAYARKLAQFDGLILVCGHYEGFDERICYFVDQQLSVGDYVLSAGEVASLVLMDSIIRLLKGVISQTSLQTESFDNYLLDFPQYTKPLVFQNLAVPKILLSGNHAAIQKARLK